MNWEIEFLHRNTEQKTLKSRLWLKLILSFAAQRCSIASPSAETPHCESFSKIIKIIIARPFYGFYQSSHFVEILSTDKRNQSMRACLRKGSLICPASGKGGWVGRRWRGLFEGARSTRTNCFPPTRAFCSPERPIRAKHVLLGLWEIIKDWSA